MAQGGLTLAEVIGDVLSLFGRLQADEFHGDGATVLVGQEEVESGSVRVLPRDEIATVAYLGRHYALPRW